MSFEAVNRELREETQAISDLSDINKITTDRIAENLHLSRTTVSQYLNDILKKGDAIQIKSRPTNFINRQIFSERFFSPKQTIYPSVASLIKEQVRQKNVFKTFIGNQESMKEIIERLITAENYPPNGLPVMLSGNTGVGKSYLAKLTYQYCVQEGLLKKDAPFVVLNCAQYYHNPELLSSNLFGYAKGSFTGATTDFKGMLESANGGVLFLDECHRLNPESQEKLFSFMDTGNFERMGENAVSRSSKVRLIFATTENLQENFLQTFLRRVPVAVTLPDLNNRSKSELKMLIFQTFIEESRRLQRYFRVAPWIINHLFNLKYKNNIGELKTTIKLICAHAYSQDQMNSDIEISSDNIGNSLLQRLTAVNNQEEICSEVVNFTPESRLTDFVDTTISENSRVNDLMTHLCDVEGEFQNDKLTAAMVIEIISRESRALMDEMVHRDKRDHNESLKYLINIIQQLFDYLGSSLFVKIKGNAVIAFASFIYLKQEVDLALTVKAEKSVHNLLELAKQNATVEYQVLKSFLELIKTKLDFRMGEVDKLLLLGYLISLNLNYKTSNKHAIILAHGYSTASSIADVANQFLNKKIFDSYDMPLNVSIQQVNDYIQQYIHKNDCHKGLIILVDMGSLMVLPDSLKANINGPLLVINNVSTQLALFVGESIEKNIAFNEIGKLMTDKLAPEYSLIYPVIKKSPMIITTCHTGIGSAKQIQSLLEHSIPTSLHYKIEAVDLEYLKKYGDSNSVFEQYDVKAIVGTSDPHIKRVPYIALENLIAGDGTSVVKTLFPDVKDTALLKRINNYLVENLSVERLLSAVTILDATKVISSVSDMMTELEENTGIRLTNNQRVTLYVHVSAMIERLIRNEPPLVYKVVSSEERNQGCTKIKRALRNIESSYGIKVDQNELNYLYDIVFQL
ncbi:sigma 54-interacting transcriptional regulator [Lacticaseibacillus paracasei]|uniref:sigma 54-interacting transcriptional regulator n=1 Tax=Lacticaseibacillus paracasei TaxID=1597 RepID=UPI00115C148E|nr:sigma 54-interacting transcriptional regulator [Lacticaseibacillus paracasei]VTZ84523.1 Transcriptional regulatory protein DagR [Lacticaseibacillus paracasei]